MKKIFLDPNTLLGGIIYQDREKEIVHLKLQPQNDLPAYQDERTLLIITLSGHAEVYTDDEKNLLTPENIILLEPNEHHKIKALTKDTHLLVIKQRNHYEQD